MKTFIADWVDKIVLLAAIALRLLTPSLGRAVPVRIATRRRGAGRVA